MHVGMSVIFQNPGETKPDPLRERLRPAPRDVEVTRSVALPPRARQDAVVEQEQLHAGDQ